jgi:hypothetical protein
MTLSAGARLGPYEIRSLIGVGGMGQVYAARDTRLDRAVVIKVLVDNAVDRPDRRRRFESEARAISSLHHSHICTLFDVGEQDGIAFFVMEYLEGETLDDRLTRGPLPGRDVLAYAAQIADALARSYLDGVDFFTTMRGTQRTPHERGYNPSDQRHNLTVAGAANLPWSIQVSAILKLISGSPTKVQAGVDLDGDSSLIGDLPDGIPITVGRERVDESLAAINAFRASRGRAPIDRSLLRLDPFRTLDVRVTKWWSIGRDRRLELLFEGFNVTNHVNFRPPFGNPPGAGVPIIAPAFLVRTNAHAVRQVQWGVRLTY